MKCREMTITSRWVSSIYSLPSIYFLMGVLNLAVLNLAVLNLAVLNLAVPY